MIIDTIALALSLFLLPTHMNIDIGTRNLLLLVPFAIYLSFFINRCLMAEWDLLMGF